MESDERIWFELYVQVLAEVPSESESVSALASESLSGSLDTDWVESRFAEL